MKGVNWKGSPIVREYIQDQLTIWRHKVCVTLESCAGYKEAMKKKWGKMLKVQWRKKRWEQMYCLCACVRDVEKGKRKSAMQWDVVCFDIYYLSVTKCLSEIRNLTQHCRRTWALSVCCIFQTFVHLLLNILNRKSVFSYCLIEGMF